MTRPSLFSLEGAGEAAFGASIVLLVGLCAVFAPWLAPHDPTVQDLVKTNLPPVFLEHGDPAYLLGTDSLGRDVLSRMLFGARIALYVAIAAGFFTMLIGGTLAVVAGYLRGWTDWIISRFVDVWLAFPPVIFGVILMVGFGPGVNNVILSIIILDWTRFTRVLRSEVMVVARSDYVVAGWLIGFSRLKIIRREIIPAILPLTITMLSIEMAIAVTVEAILSFVGLSVSPETPAWGVMIADARQSLYENPWGLIFPLLMLLSTVLGFSLLGDGLRKFFDPRQTQHRRLA